MDADEIRARLRARPVFEAALPSVVVDEAPASPAALFWRWLLDAVEAGVREPRAVTFATSDGRRRRERARLARPLAGRARRGAHRSLGRGARRHRRARRGETLWP